MASETSSTRESVYFYKNTTELRMYWRRAPFFDRRCSPPRSLQGKFEHLEYTSPPEEIIRRDNGPYSLIHRQEQVFLGEFDPMDT